MSPESKKPALTDVPVLGEEQVERGDDVAPITFVGGTGRSGTHVLSQLLSRNERMALVPVEVRFHTDADGFPGLLSGEVTLERFMKRLRGYWWKGRAMTAESGSLTRMRGMFRFVEAERFEPAAAEFERTFAEQRELACRRLFLDLLSFRAEEREDGRGIIEQSCDTVAQAATLTRIFPDARFIHVVRDGRDASASRVAQTHGLVPPRTRAGGIGWWQERIEAIELGARSIAPQRLLTVSLDELLRVDQARVALRPLFRFCGAHVSKAPRRYFNNRMNQEQANAERWRQGISPAKAKRLDVRYAAALAELEQGGARCAPLLRQTYERAGNPDLPPLAYVYGPAGDDELE